MTSRQTTTPQSLTLDTNTHLRRHGYNSATPVGGMSPQSPSSPLSLPPLLASDTYEDDSPPSSSVIVTPVSTGPIGSNAKIASDHSMLSSLAQMPTPTFGSPNDDYGSRHSFPLLPPHHPLRKKLYAAFDKEGASPPHTPKGHPINESKLHFRFSSKVSLSFVSVHSKVVAETLQARMLTITNPYNASKQSYPTTRAYFLRVRRRFRPVFLVAFCFITFSLVFLNNAVSRSNHKDSMSQQRNQIYPRRFIEIDGLVGINDRSNQAVLGQSRGGESTVVAAELPAHSEFALPSNEALTFANTQDELAALISVSVKLLQTRQKLTLFTVCHFHHRQRAPSA